MYKYYHKIIIINLDIIHTAIEKNILLLLTKITFIYYVTNCYMNIMYEQIVKENLDNTVLVKK